MSSYKNNRRSFYSNFPNFWYDLYDAEYSLYHVLGINQEVIKELKQATYRMGLIYDKTARLLRQLSNDQLLDLGFPSATLPYLKLKTIYPETVIARFDFVATEDGFKLLEFNSDTPTFIMECFQINGKVANHFGVQDPNHNSESLLSSAITKAVMESSKSIVGDRRPNVVFTAHHSHKEDWNTISYLSKLCGVDNQILSLSALQITDEALVDTKGLPIDVLYRQTYPFEHLIEDKDPITGEKVGLRLLDLVRKKKLTIVNPPSAFLLQPKAVQALIWGLAQEKEYFTNEERQWISNYMLPTYLEADALISQTPFVQKPSLGREGDTVTIFDKKNNILSQNNIQTFREEMPVFQQYVPLPQVCLETEKGTEKLSYLFGSFLIAGKPSAIGVRAGEKITANESYFLPVGIQFEEAKKC